MLLRLKELSKSFGGLQVLTQISTDIEAGEIVGLIGPNGAGKSTLFNLITGIYAPAAGRYLSRTRRSRACRPIKSRAWELPGPISW